MWVLIEVFHTNDILIYRGLLKLLPFVFCGKLNGDTFNIFDRNMHNKAIISTNTHRQVFIGLVLRLDNTI